MRVPLIIALLVCPIAAMADQTEALARITPYDDPAGLAEFEGRCDRSGRVFQVTLSKSETQTVRRSGIFVRRLAKPVYLVERRGNDVQKTRISDASPVYKDIMDMRFGIDVDLMVCASAFSVSYLAGSLQVRGESESYGFQRDLSFEDIAEMDGARLDIRYAQSLYRSDPDATVGNTVTIPRAGGGRTFYKRDLLDGMSISVENLPVTMVSTINGQEPIDELIGFDIGFKLSDQAP